MRAAELIYPLTFRLTDMPIEDPGPGEVQVRIEAVGVCGSDLHAYSRGRCRQRPFITVLPETCKAAYTRLIGITLTLNLPSHAPA